MKRHETEFLVIGSGLAGLAFALKMAEAGSQVTIVSKTAVSSSNTQMAQGGIAAVVSKEDSFEEHIKDTLIAGAGLCRLETVENLVHQAPDRILDLARWGVDFDFKTAGDQSQSWDLTREGGHSARRVLHFEDQTGREIHSKLSLKVLSHPSIKIRQHCFAIDLIVNRQIDPYDMSSAYCVGAYVLDQSTGLVESYTAKATILATGGAGKVYLYTSNWDGATGDGIAMAYRSGVRVANLEFMQFHPTCLYHPSARNFLISEALRGEGAELINSAGEAFMSQYHERGSLAPRDIVARSIDAEMKTSGSECVYLDATQHSREYLESRFPAIFQKCMDLGIDISKEPIPVVPAAHYLCGGVLTNVHGQTDLKSLFVLGEAACTGLHGANRLASNSLLECVGMAHNCSEILLKHKDQYQRPSLIPPDWQSPNHSNEDEMVVITHMWDEVRRLMWNYVGIVRSTKRLERAQHRLNNMLLEIREYYSNFNVHSDILELRNIAIVADLTVRCALKRQESRGIHFNLDYEKTQTDIQDSIVFHTH